ncbi:MAG: GNAT family N-acetyltransferase [Clostridia bacterium]|nr:GNAT family N-acetyltransferase [Clostridia bacterium]
MQHIGTQTIETERLILRRFKIEDAQDMFENYANSEKVAEFVKWNAHKNVEETEEYLQNCVLPKYENPDNYCWAVVLKELGQVIGCIDVVGMDEKYLRAELGWVLGEKFWGKGYMPEAGKAVLKLLFDLGFVRVQAKHHLGNPKSGRVMEKLGMTYEGILKKYDHDKEGNLIDLKFWAITK